MNADNNNELPSDGLYYQVVVTDADGNPRSDVTATITPTGESVEHVFTRDAVYERDSATGELREIDA